MIATPSLLAAALPDTRWWSTILVALIGFGLGPVIVAIARRCCVEPIPRRLDSPRGSLVVGGAMATGGAIVFLGGSSPASGFVLVAGLALLIIISLVDIAEHRIPNRLTYPAIGSCLLAAMWAVTGVNDPVAVTTPAISAMVGGLVFALLLLVPHLVRPDAMGLGDVKLAFPLGFVIGWVRADAVEVVIAVGWTLAGAAALGLVVAGSLRRRSVAFGPALSVAALLAVALLS